MGSAGKYGFLADGPKISSGGGGVGYRFPSGPTNALGGMRAVVAVELRPVEDAVVAVVECPLYDGVDVLGVDWYTGCLPLPFKSLKGVGERRGGAGDTLVPGVGDTGGTLAGSADVEADGLGDVGGDRATNGKSVSLRLAGAGEGECTNGCAMC